MLSNKKLQLISQIAFKFRKKWNNKKKEILAETIYHEAFWSLFLRYLPPLSPLWLHAIIVLQDFLNW